MERSIQPSQYLDYLKQCWDADTAAEALGCEPKDIRELQRSRRFVERFLQETVQVSGPAAMQDFEGESLIELIGKQKFQSFWALREIAEDPDVNPNVRTKVHLKFVDAGLLQEGLTQKIDHSHTHTHRLDPESAKQIADAQQESARLISAPIDITPEEG